MSSDVGRELTRGDWEPSVRIPQPPEPWAGSWWWWQRPWGGSLGRAGVPEGSPHWQTGRAAVALKSLAFVVKPSSLRSH